MNQLRQRLVLGPQIKDGDGKGLLSLTDSMFHCEVSFQSWDKLWMLESPELMHGLFERLPYKIKAQFVSAHTDDGKFKDLRILVEKAAAEANGKFGMLLYNSKVNQSEKGKKIKKQVLRPISKSHFVCSAQQGEQQSRVQTKKLYTLCQELHPIWKCSKFKELSVQERYNIAKERNLCFNCLMQNHHAINCRSKLLCRKCGRRHNTLLHFESKLNSKCVSVFKESVSDEEMCSNTSNDSTKNACAATSCSKISGRSFFKVVPIKVWAKDPDKFLYTYAFIDEGSNVNMCSETLVKKLGVSVSGSNIELVTSNATSLIESKVDGLGIEGIDEPAAFFVKDALVVKELVDVSPSIPTQEIAECYPHLKNLSFPLLKNSKVELVLGTDLH